MIEIALGLFVVFAVFAMLAGVGGLVPGASGFDPLPLLGYGGILTLLALGVLLIAAGGLRRAIARTPERRHALRTTRLSAAGVLAVIAFAAGPAITAEIMNLMTLAGSPGGYYIAAEGALIGLVAVAFLWAARQDRIDREESVGD